MMHPWRFKPFYCILHPLDLDEQGRITVDSTEDLLEEQGSCLVPSDQPVPLIETFANELQYLLGAKGIPHWKMKLKSGEAHNDYRFPFQSSTFERLR